MPYRSSADILADRPTIWAWRMPTRSRSIWWRQGSHCLLSIRSSVRCESLRRDARSQHDPGVDRYAREPRKLPVVLGTDEMVSFLDAIPSLKSRIALMTVYASRLRVGGGFPHGRWHRQPADGDPSRTRQRRQRSLRHALAAASKESAGLLVANPTRTVLISWLRQ